MPLLPGKKNIGRNITELTKHGSRKRSHKQIVAIALHEAYGNSGYHASRRMSKKASKMR